MNTPSDSAFQLQWREALSVKNDAIDRDHRRLIGLINRVQSMLAHDSSVGELTQALDELADYTATHFRREEAIQQAIGYPEARSHAMQHRDLTHQLHTITAEILSLAHGGNTVHALAPELRQRILNLFREWLITHIIQQDLRYKPWLERFPSDWTPATVHSRAER